ncbi:MaoC/PaaZ C-terminal domain-containing protein [Arthrobacter rhombi]|uniref:MaoC/PaaZ C-terminal domain-containing protein n=1 Tax=Arthrobacter rhombi TaxID=71253 RepID=UPI003FCF66C6
MSRRLVPLDAVPALPRLYAEAVAHQVRNQLSRYKTELVLPEVEHSVHGVVADQSRLEAYQQLVGDTVRPHLPSVFIHGTVFPVAMSVLAARDFPLPLLGMVHLSNQVEHLRPVGVDEVLDVRAWTEKLRDHQAGTQLDVVCEVSVGTEIVWVGTSTYLAKGIWAGQRPERRGQRPEFVPPRQTGAWRLGPGTGREYAAVLGDYNPIHLGALPAKALGMKRQIAHGMFLAGKALAQTAPLEGGYHWDILFEAPVLLPSTVSFGVATTGKLLSFEGWNAKKGRRHFQGAVRAL